MIETGFNYINICFVAGILCKRYLYLFARSLDILHHQLEKELEFILAVEEMMVGKVILEKEGSHFVNGTLNGTCETKFAV